MKYDPVKIGEIISSNRKLLESPERKGKRMNQEELGYKLGCSRKTIGKWEDGQAIPPLDAMLKMCEMFECELDYLLGVIDCKNRVDYEITGQIPLSEETVKGLRELMYDIQDQQPYSFPDGFGGVDSIDAQLLAGLIDRVVSALLYCHNVWGLDGDALLSKTLNMIIAREYHNETFDENDQLHGDYRLFESMKSALEGTRYEFGRELGVIAEKYMSNYFNPSDELKKYREQQNIKLPSWMD